MARILLLLAAIAAGLAGPAFAQSVPSTKTLDPKGYYVQLQAPCTTQGNNDCIAVTTAAPLPVAIVSGGGGGGGGGGDASASNQATQITVAQLTNATLGAVTASPAQYTIGDRLKSIGTILGTPFQAGGSIGNTVFGATQSGTWTIAGISGAISLPTGAATSAAQTTGNASLATIAAHVGTPGSATPGTAAYVAGVGPSGSLRGIATDLTGGLVPSAASIGSARYTLVANTITLVGAASSGTGIGYKFQIEGATLAADLFICYAGQSATCSATVHDDMIPSGSTAGTRLNYEWPVKTAVYLFSAGTPVVNVTRSVVN